MTPEDYHDESGLMHLPWSSSSSEGSSSSRYSPSRSSTTRLSTTLSASTTSSFWSRSYRSVDPSTDDDNESLEWSGVENDHDYHDAYDPSGADLGAELRAELRALRREALSHELGCLWRNFRRSLSWSRVLAVALSVLLFILYMLQRPREISALVAERHSPNPVMSTMLDVRASDEAALDRLAFMMPGHWDTWLTVPIWEPSLPYVMQANLSKTLGRLRSLVREAEEPYESHSGAGVQCADTTRKVQHALGFSHDESERARAFDTSLPSGWLANAAICANSTAWNADPWLGSLPRLTCLLTNKGISDKITGLFDAIAATVEARLRFTAKLHRDLSILSDQAKTEALASVVSFHSLLHAYVHDPTIGELRLDQHLHKLESYTYKYGVSAANLRDTYAFTQFLSLLTESVLPALEERVQAVLAFQEDVLHAQRHLHVVQTNDVARWARSTIRFWLASGQWDLVVRSVNLPNRTMRRASCNWTLRHMPLRRQPSPPPPPSRFHSCVDAIAKRILGCLTRPSNLQNWLYSALLYHAWQSPDAPTAYWHWEGSGPEGGFVLEAAEVRLADEDRSSQLVPPFFSATGSNRCESLLEMSTAAMHRQARLHLPPRFAEDEIRVTWPAVRSRLECRSRHRCHISDGEDREMKREELKGDSKAQSPEQDT